MHTSLPALVTALLLSPAAAVNPAWEAPHPEARPTTIVLPASTSRSALSSTGAKPIPADTTVTILRVAPQGNRARYRVREQLASLDFPSDAVGETRSIQGQVVVHPDGTVDREASRIVIDMTSLESDQDRRDNFLRRNTLETERHPTLTLIPIALRGLPNPLPAEGEHRFVIVAEMVLKGVTHPTTWDVQATFANGAVLGQASTILTFDRLGLEKPRVRSVLSVADDIRLEYEFRLVPGEEG
jgi:polyisoprenoid-binding protein YceI